MDLDVTLLFKVEYSLFEFKVFSPRLVALLRVKNLVYPTIYPWLRKGEQMEISAK